jgi:hypothetical protein
LPRYRSRTRHTESLCERRIGGSSPRQVAAVIRGKQAQLETPDRDGPRFKFWRAPNQPHQSRPSPARRHRGRARPPHRALGVSPVPKATGLMLILKPVPVGPATTRSPPSPQRMPDRGQHANPPRPVPGRQSARPPKPSGAHVPSDVGVLVRPSLTHPLGLLGRLRAGIAPLPTHGPGLGPTRRPPDDPPPGAHERLPGSSHHGSSPP